MKKIYTIALFAVLVVTTILPCKSIMALGGELINGAKKEIFAIDEVLLSRNIITVHYYGLDENIKTNFLNVFWVDFEKVPEEVADQKLSTVSTITPEWAENYYCGKSELSPDNKGGIWHSRIYNNQNTKTLADNKSNVLYYVVQLKNGFLIRGKADYRNCVRMEEFNYENGSCKLEKKCNQLYYWGYLAGYGRLGDDGWPITSCDVKDEDDDDDDIGVGGDIDAGDGELNDNDNADIIVDDYGDDGEDGNIDFDNDMVDDGNNENEGVAKDMDVEENKNNRQDIINFNGITKENDNIQETMDDASDQINASENNEKMENIEMEVPNLGGSGICEKNIYFPWWFLVLLAICDVILLWWWSPKKERQKNR